MLRLDELLSWYPENQRVHRRHILREYLQCKILEIVFNEPDLADRLCFLGGTCLRLIHGNTRFSEDLDFDNHGLNENEFQAISEKIQKELTLQGYEVEMKTIYKGAFHCHLRMPGILFKEKLTGHIEEKILIQLDAEPQHFEFNPERHILNRFDVFTEIPVTPMAVLLAQKIYAIINRRRSKGRDFYDVVFLLSKDVKPDYGYLNLKLGISDPTALKARLLDTCAKLNMKDMARDVTPFLFNAADAKRVEMFEAYLKQVEL
jgi:predicted nucleotidyltransferase component of viral defense system